MVTHHVATVKAFGVTDDSREKRGD